MAASGWSSGRWVRNRYRLKSEIEASDPVEISWLAEDAKRGEVCVTAFDPAVVGDAGLPPGLVEVVTTILSPYIQRTFDAGVDEGVPFLVTELVDGERLSARIRREGHLRPADALRFVGQLLQGVGAVHSIGLVCGGINPGSICIRSSDNSAVLLNLGAGQMRPRRDADIQVGGIPSLPIEMARYLSPEQARGSKVDSKGDLWSVAMVAFECLTGRPAFIGDSSAALTIKVASGVPPSPSSVGRVPSGFDAWFAQATDRDPERRFRTSEEMERALREIAEKPLPPLKNLALGALGGTTKLIPVGAPTAPSPPPWVDEQVQFTVYRPQRVAPEVWCTMLVFAHLSEKRPEDPESAPDPVEEVARRARAALGDAATQYRHSTEDATEGLPAGGELTVVPFVPGVTFNPTTRSFQWREAVHEETFRLLASAALNGKTAHGRLTVFHGNIILAEINLAIAVGGGAATSTEPNARDSARPYRKIFASYSHKDAAVVDEFSRHVSALGDQYLRDAVSLRSGEEWSERLAALIGEADIFQLFWSRHSMRSIHVRREWEHALSLQRNNFIRPTYWEEPLPAAVEADLPPEALRRLHFQLLQAPRRPDGDSAFAPSPAPPPVPRGVLLRLSSGLAAAAGLALVLGSGFAAFHQGMATTGRIPIAVSPTLAPSAAPTEAVGLQGQAPSDPIPVAAVHEASTSSPNTNVLTASPTRSAPSKLAAIKKEQAMVDALLARMEKTNDPQQKSQLKEQLDAHERQLQSLEGLNAVDTGY
jgi:TIR domain-containing protein/protein kinase-like protein